MTLSLFRSRTHIVAANSQFALRMPPIHGRRPRPICPRNPLSGGDGNWSSPAYLHTLLPGHVHLEYEKIRGRRHTNDLALKAPPPVLMWPRNATLIFLPAPLKFVKIARAPLPSQPHPLKISSTTHTLLPPPHTVIYAAGVQVWDARCAPFDIRLVCWYLAQPKWALWFVHDAHLPHPLLNSLDDYQGRVGSGVNVNLFADVANEDNSLMGEFIRASSDMVSLSSFFDVIFPRRLLLHFNSTVSALHLLAHPICLAKSKQMAQ
ncbi:hypothetical protein B0H17DRAFT_1218269 [Mycena rosella]|uniref:Uncharacterized protein n=1 Tax=Mycena rosella TaxID=1033263 RepID=A0AAD7BSP9_MYCRO|nr:hypothetical protein B0H17DRAFT_1218269 [Mycena rosella]